MKKVHVPHISEDAEHFPLKGRKRKGKEKENEASVTCLKLVSSSVAESRLQLEEFIQADTSGQIRAANGSIWARQSRNNRTERTWGTRRDDSEVLTARESKRMALCLCG